MKWLIASICIAALGGLVLLTGWEVLVLVPFVVAGIMVIIDMHFNMKRRWGGWF